MNVEVLDHLLLEPNLVAVEDSVFVTNLDFLDMAEQQENLSKIRKVCIYTQLIYLGMDSHMPRMCMFVFIPNVRVLLVIICGWRMGLSFLLRRVLPAPPEE